MMTEEVGTLRKCSKCKCQKLLKFYSKRKNTGVMLKTCDPCRASRPSRKDPNLPAKRLKECQEYAKSKGGNCLSTEYKGSKINMKWKCKEGHEWMSKINFMKSQNQWCPHCAGCVKKTIEECRKIAQERGGECLSTEYKNAHTKMKWKCKEGHEWEAKFNNIKNQNQWCIKCSGYLKHTIQKCQKVARERDGLCLSTEYKNAHTKMKWKCKEGHEWETAFSNIKNQNHWCLTCSGSEILTIEECRKVAQERGGECLSTEYKCNKSKMKWRCSKEHEWETAFSNIKNNNRWCPTCSSGRSEELCRELLKARTGEDFKKVRPTWLDGLELDGYAKSINMAFEYNGAQHYKYVPHFHRNGIEDFKAQQERDQKKYRICKQRGIQLVLIPYKFNCYNPDELETFIVDQLETLEF